MDFISSANPHNVLLPLTCSKFKKGQCPLSYPNPEMHNISSENAVIMLALALALMCCNVYEGQFPFCDPIPGWTLLALQTLIICYSP